MVCRLVAIRNPTPTSVYRDLKNVDVFIDSSGMIRYVVGHFSYRKQAENLLKTIIEKGFTDAFVVNVNDEKKYSNEVISYNNINLRSGHSRCSRVFRSIGFI